MTAREIRQDVHRWAHEIDSGDAQVEQGINDLGAQNLGHDGMEDSDALALLDTRGEIIHDLLDAFNLGEARDANGALLELPGCGKNDFASGVAERIGDDQHGGRKLVGMRGHRCTSGT